MRNPERLELFYKELEEIHRTYFCDWRFGQLCYNFFSWLMKEKKVDCFFPEEGQMIKYLKEYANNLR